MTVAPPPPIRSPMVYFENSPTEDCGRYDHHSLPPPRIAKSGVVSPTVVPTRANLTGNGAVLVELPAIFVVNGMGLILLAKSFNPNKNGSGLRANISTFNARQLNSLVSGLCLNLIPMELAGAWKDEFVTSLAALALYDGDGEISSENINTLIGATNNTVAPYWPVLFANLLKNGRIETIVLSGGAGGGSGPAPAAAAVAAGGDAKQEEKKAEKPKEEEVDALDGGMDMFGGSGGGGGGGDY
eukprot:gene3488-6940_t